MPILVGLAGWAGRLKPRTTFLAAALTLVLLPTVARLLVVPAPTLHEWDETMRRVTLFHLDATGWGVLAAIASRWWPEGWSRGKRGKALLGLVLIVLGCVCAQSYYFGGWLLERAPRLNNVLSLALPAAGTVLALPWIASLRPRGGAFGWTVDRISAYSYSIYLCHIPLMFVLGAALSPEARLSAPAVWAQAAVWFILVFPLAAIVHHVFEKPVSDLRERFTRKVDANPFAVQG